MPTATQILQQQDIYNHLHSDPFVTYSMDIDETLLSVQKERDDRHIQIDYQLISCACDFTTLIRLEYSTDGNSDEHISIKCPACGQRDTPLTLHNIHPDGANIRIIDTWHTQTKVKWDGKRLQPQPTPYAPNRHEIAVVDCHARPVPFTHEKEFRVSFIVPVEVLRLMKSHKDAVTYVADLMRQYIYDHLSGGLY